MLVILVEANRGMIDFSRGFGKETKEDKEKKEYYDKIVKKLNKLK